MYIYKNRYRIYINQKIILIIIYDKKIKTNMFNC
jgi:hypothetical protein